MNSCFPTAPGLHPGPPSRSASLPGCTAGHNRTPPYILLAGLAAVLLFSPGCGTTSTEGRLLATTVQTVDAAMQGWSTYVALEKATPAQDLAVRRIYAKYQAAESVAEVAFVAAAKTSDPSIFKRASVALLAAQGELLALIASFTPHAALPTPH